MGAYFISVMQASAVGRKTPPDWPDITDIVMTNNTHNLSLRAKAAVRRSYATR